MYVVEIYGVEFVCSRICLLQIIHGANSVGKVVMVIRSFKGYYFKCSMKKASIAFIPVKYGRRHSANSGVQVITEDASYFVPLQNIRFIRTKKNSLKIRAGNSLFTTEGIRLDIQDDNVRAIGRINFTESDKIRYDIMGPFRFLPFLQCRHSVVSMSHLINGRLMINGRKYCFQDGMGYIEGDSGYSFPGEYAWTQCHHEDISLMMAVADIPIMGFHFIGVISVIKIYGHEYRLATYLGAKATHIGDGTIVVKQGRYRFLAALIHGNELKLSAPKKGRMERIIHESACCTVRYRLEWDDKKMFDFRSDMASFEYEFMS